MLQRKEAAKEQKRERETETEREETLKGRHQDRARARLPPRTCLTRVPVANLLFHMICGPKQETSNREEEETQGRTEEETEAKRQACI